MIKDVYNYFESCTVEDEHGELKLVSLPSRVGCSIYMKVHEKSFRNWAKDKDKQDFFLALEWVDSFQEQSLVDGGAFGLLNPTITKLILMNNHNYKERRDNTSGDEPIEQIKFYIPKNNRE